jgi:hypothetical protein
MKAISIFVAIAVVDSRFGPSNFLLTEGRIRIVLRAGGDRLPRNRNGQPAGVLGSPSSTSAGPRRARWLKDDLRSLQSS